MRVHFQRRKVVTLCGAFPGRYNKQVLKAFHFPFTCTNLQVHHPAWDHRLAQGEPCFCCQTAPLLVLPTQC